MWEGGVETEEPSPDRYVVTSSVLRTFPIFVKPIKFKINFRRGICTPNLKHQEVLVEGKAGPRHRKVLVSVGCKFEVD